MLGKLLDLVEKTPVEERSNRVSVAMARTSWESDDRESLYGRLAAAAGFGAVYPEWGTNESSHLIEKIVLLDENKLYDFLGRRPWAEEVSEALAALRARVPNLGERAAPLLDHLGEAWRRKRLVAGLGPTDVKMVAHCLLAVDALADGRLDEQDIRTFSRKATGYSKFVEANQGKIVDLLRLIVDVPGDLDAEEVLASHGIVRFPHPCLISGRVTLNGQVLPAEPYIGIAPERVSALGVAEEPEWILTIENLTSFNRQVREARGNGIILYTAGFPSRAMLACLEIVVRSSQCPVFHWGDIDGGGLRIFRHIERFLEARGSVLRPHLMSPLLYATSSDDRLSRHGLDEIAHSRSAVSAQAAWLLGPDGRCLEQEEIDPAIPDMTQFLR